MESNYELLKMLHIFGAVLFVGNIIVTAFWKAMADRTGDARIAAFGQQMVNGTDVAFTGLGAFIILVTGLFMSQQTTGPLFDPKFFQVTWLAWGVGLFLASGLVWMLFLFPLQVRLIWLARRFVGSGEVPDDYRRLGRWWLRAALVAIALALGNLYFMIAKPIWS